MYADNIHVTPSQGIPLAEQLVAPNIPQLEVDHVDKAAYEMNIGRYFDNEWTKTARTLKRQALLRAPNRPNLDAARLGGIPTEQSAAVRPLDVIDWESQIVFNTE